MAGKESPRLAIIGCGFHVEFTLIPALRRIDWIPSVLVDRSGSRLETVARKIGWPGIVQASEWQSTADEFDAALVALPHVLHGATGVALAEAGKHVFMEAPLAIRGDECRAMITAAARNRVMLSVGLYRRYLQGARWTKALLQSGSLGEVAHFDVRESTVFSSGTGSDLSFEPDVSGGGVLADIGAHTFDLLLWWFGDVTPVRYRDDNEGGFEADCILECGFASGGSGRIELSRTRQLRNSVRIEGTQGFIEVHLHRNELIAASANALAFRHDGVDPQTMSFQFPADLFDAALRDFKMSLAGDGHSGVPGRDGAAAAELIERCYAIRQPLRQPWTHVASDADGVLPRLPAGSKVLVTGATGFVGGRLVERLAADGHQVHCAIRTVGRAARLARLPVELVDMDLGNAGAIERAVAGIDYVFHCAHDTRSREQNIEGLRNIIAACAAHPVVRLVYVSTCAVYEPFRDGPLTEESPDGDRSNTYVDTKLEMEGMIFEAAQSGLAATIIQPAIVYGPFCQPWTNTPAEKLIFGDVILPDRGEGLCNAVYIDDLIDSLILAAVSPAAVGERFIVSGPAPVSWATFFTEIARALGAGPPKFWPLEKIAAASPGVTRNIRAVVIHPKRLIRMAARWNLVRQILLAGLDMLPGSAQLAMKKYYFAPRGRRTGEMFLPSRHALALYRSKATATAGKARSMLGYQPRFDFQRGMTLTRGYLAWAYEDIRRTNLPDAAPSSQSTPTG